MLSTVLIVSWFRHGLLYGGGDVGIPSYNPMRIVEIARFVWWESSAPGNLVPHGVTSLPMQIFQTVLVRAGLPYFAVQASVFWILLFLTGYGMFLVGLSVFGKDKLLLAMLCGLFYMLNPYMMIQVWHRFIHNSFFLAAFLPFFYLFWDDWIKRGKFISILLFLLANIFGVYLYGTIAFAVTIVFVLSFIFLRHVFIPWQGFKFLKKITFRFISGLILWFLIHLWWIWPTFAITPALFSIQHRTFDSVSTLITLSRQTGIPYVLSGINPFYLFEQADFGEIYKHPGFLIMMFLPLVFLIPGFMAVIRSKKLAGWGILLAVAVFLAKGAAPPFGFAYIFALTKVFVLGVLRNPFEKMGILLPFSAAIIMTAGINWYLGKFRNKFTKILIGSLLFLQLGIFLWPMWSGKLIGKFDKLAFVDVPLYYQKADDFLKLQKKDGRILHLPLPLGESITYNWPYGFSGIESSQLLFSAQPSISRALNIKHVDDIVSAASNVFREKVADEKIIAVLQNLNVRFIVLHQDIRWEGGFLDNPLNLKETLDSKSFLKKRGAFGELLVYEIASEYFRPKIYTTAQVNLLSPGEKNSFWPYLLSQNNADLISTIDSKDKSINPLQIVVIPTKVWIFQPKEVPLEKAIAELPAASKILPGSRLYFLIKLKEDFRILMSLGSDKVKLKLNLLGKRLVEAVRLKEKGKIPEASINAYRKLLVEVFYTDNLGDQLDFIGGRGFVSDLFAKHLTILDTLEGIKDAKDELLMALRESELIPMYDVALDKNTGDLEYTAYHFQIPRDDKYELLMSNAKVRNVYPDNLEKLEFQINGEKKELTGRVVNGFISYGEVKLDVGRREITLAATSSANLVSSVDQNNSFFETKIEPLTSDTWYTVKFEAKILSGNKFKLQFVVDGNVDFEKFFTKDDQDGWKSYREGIFFNKPVAEGAKIRLFADKADSSVTFRNIKIERLLNNPIFLRSTLPGAATESISPVEFTRYSPVYYSGKIKLEREGLVIFSESFHPDWQLRLSDSQGISVPEKRFLANMYANAWFIPQAGEYNFELEFTPQKTLYKGLIVSLATFLFAVIFLIKKWLEK